MKILNSATKQEYEKNASTLCTCLKITRTDGLVLRVTDYDENLIVDGELYEPVYSYNMSTINSSKDMSVDTLEIDAIYNPVFFNEKDIIARKLDNAKFVFFRTSFLNTTVRDTLKSGYLGSITKTKNRLKIELRGLAQILQQSVTEFYTERCRASFGDSKCKKDKTSFTLTTTMDVVNNNASFTINSASAYASQYFQYGYIEFTNGLNKGIIREIANHNASSIETFEAFPFVISTSDTIKIVAGCDKNLSTCVNKFNNEINFRGFPFIPGPDKIYGSEAVPENPAKNVGHLLRQ